MQQSQTTDNARARPAVVLQISDTHLHAAADGRMRGVTTYETFQAVLAQALRDPRWPPDAIIASGDIVQDESRAGYERFRASLAPFGVPVLCIPGNHDDPALMAELLNEPPFQLEGEHVLERWSLILLSTFLHGADGGGLGPERLRRLRESLQRHADRHALICMHHQPLPMGSAWLDGVGLRDAEDLLALVDGSPNVRCVVWGHVHQASDRERHGVRYLSTPSTCAQFLPRSDYFALDSRPPGMRWLELFPDGTIATSVEWVAASGGAQQPR